MTLDTAPRSLWQHRDFMKLWSAQTVSLFGTTIHAEALPLAAIMLLEASPVQMGLLGALATAPAFLIGLPAGLWVDRMRRRPIMIAADLGRAALLLTIPLASLAGVLYIEHLYLVALLAGGLGVFYDVAYQSILPWLVGRQHLFEANSKLGMGDSMAEIAGPAAGGALVQAISAPFALLVDAFSFIFSATTLGTIGQSEPQPVRAPTEAPVRTEILAGLRATWHSRGLRALAGASSTLNFFGAFIGAIYGLYVIEQLRMTPVVLGILVSSGGVGALLGAILSGRVAARFGAGRALVMALLLSSAMSILIPLASGNDGFSVALLVVAQVCGDLALAIFLIGEISLRQAFTPDHLLGRVNAGFRFLIGGAVTSGLLVGGVLGQYAGLRPTLYLSVVGMLFSAAWLVSSPLNQPNHTEGQDL
jgi:MFS family permease